jgi:hypothetical protein
MSDVKVARMEKTSHTRSPSVKGGVVMDIHRFKEEMEKSKPGDSFESKVFLAGDKPFRLHVYPNGIEEQYKGHVGVEVAYHGEEDVDVESMEITTTTKEGRGGALHSTTILSKDDAVYWKEWCTHAECLASMKDNIFDVKAEVQLLGERVIIGRDAEDVTGDKSSYMSDFKTLHSLTSSSNAVPRPSSATRSS